MPAITRPTASEATAARGTAHPVPVPAHPAGSLTAAQLAHFRARLITMRGQLLAADAVPSDAVPARGDDADVARATGERIASLADTARRRDQLREVSAALKRIADGDYGLCEETGEPISVARLEANPTARYSLAAQERIERQRATRRQ